MDPQAQITKSSFETDLVGFPRQTIDAGRCITLQLAVPRRSVVMWCMSEVNFSVFFCLATSRMRGPPPMKWSDSKYGFATEEDCNGEEAQA
jgi:hypothetical protein